MKQNKCQVLKKSIYQENFFKKKFKKPSLDAVFFLDLSVTLKQQATQLILENGGTITLFSNKCKYFIVEDLNKLSSRAEKIQSEGIISIVPFNWLLKKINSLKEKENQLNSLKKSLETDPELLSLLENLPPVVDLNQLISVSTINEKSKPLDLPSPTFNSSQDSYLPLPSNIEIYSPENDSISSGLNLEIIKQDTLIKSDQFTHLEFHSTENGDYFRIFVQSGYQSNLDQSEKKLCFFSNFLDTEIYYNNFFKQLLKKSYQKITLQTLSIGSELAKKESIQSSKYVSLLSQEERNFIEYIYSEATSSISKLLHGQITSTGIDTPMGRLNLDQVEKAQAVLHSIYTYLQETTIDSLLLAQLSNQFYSFIPSLEKIPIKTVTDCVEKLELCQILQDIFGVSEVNGIALHGDSTDVRYKALNCEIKHLNSQSSEFQSVSELIKETIKQEKSDFQIKNIFSISKYIENTCFTEHIPNKRLLFHGSKVGNWVGILSRGLLLPKINYLQRTDAGMLGLGIYFSSSPLTSAKYASPGSKGSRFLLVSEVCLGKVKSYKKIVPNLSEPPPGFQSVHGIKTTLQMLTDFKDEEFVIFNKHQQKMKYLIEFTTSESILTPILDEFVGKNSIAANIFVQGKEEEEIEWKFNEEEYRMKNIEAGLISLDERQSISLKAVHVRAKITDLIGQVTILQHYENSGSSSLEAKYVLPLDEMSAVCGFEAFINGKHVIGVVKEKEKAHKEYKEAIERGDGAYLLDQEKGDIFSVTIGNLPPKAQVLIKIVYVTELTMDREEIRFILPTCLTTDLSDTVLHSQSSKFIKVESSNTKIDIQVNVQMSQRILRIHSPSHSILKKQTDTLATVEIEENQSLSRGFILLIQVENSHSPRMWLERDVNGHYASLVAFYPEFDLEEIHQKEYIFLIDRSNSMKGETFGDCKRTLALCIKHLPKACLFNVVDFGTSFERLFIESVSSTEQNKSLALQHIANMKPNFGGTDLSKILKSICTLKRSIDSHPCQIFILTDGQISNSDSTLELIRKNLNLIRIFTFGIGETCSRHMVRTLASTGRGVAEFITPHKIPSIPKIRKHLLRALQYANPAQITSVFRGDRILVYGFVGNCTQATLEAKKFENKSFSNTVNTPDLALIEGNLIHKLCARSMIRDWTEGNLHEDVIQHNAIKMETKEEIIQLSLDYSLASEFTSFVAIEDRSKDNQIQAAAPSISELIEKENVDSLDYMGFESILLIEEENEKPKSQFSDQNLSLETCLEFAKLADMSKRYDDVIVLMENVIGSPLREENLLFEEIKLYKDACSIKLKSLEESWKSLHTIEEDQIQKNLWQNVTEIMKGKRKVEKEIKQLVEKISKLGETEVVTKSGIESQIGFLLLSGTGWQIFGTVHPSQEAKNKAIELLSKTYSLSQNELQNCHPYRLTCAIQLATAYRNLLGDNETACSLLKTTFDDSISQLDTLDEASYLESTYIMQIMRDNLTLWTVKGKEEDEGKGTHPQVQKILTHELNEQFNEDSTIKKAKKRKNKAKATQEIELDEPLKEKSKKAVSLDFIVEPCSVEPASESYKYDVVETAPDINYLTGITKNLLDDFTEAEPAKKLVAPTVVSGIGPSYKKGIGAQKKSTVRKRNQQFVSLLPHKTNKNLNSILSPFGFYLHPALKKLNDSQLTHVLMGPQNKPFKGTCWLNAILLLGLSLKSIQQWVLAFKTKGADFLSPLPRHYASSLFHYLTKFYGVWMLGDHCSIYFRKELSVTYNKVWDKFDSLGFVKGASQCAIEGFECLLQKVEQYLSNKDWIILKGTQVINQFFVSGFNSQKYSEPFIILANDQYSPLPFIPTLGHYQLHSMITFEEIEKGDDLEPVNHFMCLGFDKEGYFIYDDLLNLSPGGYQGGYVSKDSSSYIPNLEFFFRYVPLLIYKRSE